MELADGAGLRREIERYVESRVTGRLDQDQLSQGQHVLVFP